MKPKNIIKTQLYKAPCGMLRIGALDNMLCLCDWQVEPHHSRMRKHMMQTLKAIFEESTSAVINQATEELDDYFAGKRRMFEVPLLFVGTNFQKKVWNALLTLPFGTTNSYAQIACSIGTQTSVRAVANAIGANAISIFVPCHRVIGSDHSLKGYGGGLAAKQFLLQLEGVH